MTMKLVLPSSNVSTVSLTVYRKRAKVFSSLELRNVQNGVNSDKTFGVCVQVKAPIATLLRFSHINVFSKLPAHSPNLF